jgi:hypothetical protein
METTFTPTKEDAMQIGDVVKFREPLNEAEAQERYRVVDVVGAYGSVKVSDATGKFHGWIVEPVFTFRAADLVVEEG